jgi:hypothetical protein
MLQQPNRAKLKRECKCLPLENAHPCYAGP